MFDFFKNKDLSQENTVVSDMENIAQDMSKVVLFPEAYRTTPYHSAETPSQSPAGNTAYNIGLTDNNRVSLTIGYSSVSMNSVGVQQLIDQLTLFKSQIQETQQ
jgi:hypothetical protein